MKRTRILYKLVTWVCIGLCSTAVLNADDEITALLIEQVLDDPARIDFKNVTLEEAFVRLSKATGVKFDLEEAAPALAQLPYGKLTRVSAKLQGITWRQALSEILKPFALTFQPARDRIYILGTDDLMRQPSRLTHTELEALVLLQTTPLDHRSENILRQLNTEVNKRLAPLNIQYEFHLVVHGKRIEEIDRGQAQALLSKVPLPAAEILHRFSKRIFRRGEPGIWYLRQVESQSKTRQIDILVVNAEELIEKKLNQRIDIKFVSQPVQTILHKLAQRSVVDITFEPGCIALVDANLRDNCSLVMRSGSIKTALEALSGMTGLAYYYDAQGIHITASESLKTIKPGRTQIASVELNNPVVCILTSTLPGTDLETQILIRQSDLQKEGLLEKYQRVQKTNLETFMDSLRAFKLADEP